MVAWEFASVQADKGRLKLGLSSTSYSIIVGRLLPLGILTVVFSIASVLTLTFLCLNHYASLLSRALYATPTAFRCSSYEQGTGLTHQFGGTISVDKVTLFLGTGRIWMLLNLVY